MTGPFCRSPGRSFAFISASVRCLRSLPTYWLGDIDQREMVLSDIEKFTIRPLSGEKIVLGGNGRMPSAEEIDNARQIILRNAGQYRRAAAGLRCVDDFLSRRTKSHAAAGSYSFRSAKVRRRIRCLSGSADARFHGGISFHGK